MVDLTQTTSAPPLTPFATLSYFALWLKPRKMGNEDLTQYQEFDPYLTAIKK